MRLSDIPDHDLRKLCAMDFRRLVLLDLNSVTWYYLSSLGLVHWYSTFCAVAVVLIFVE